MSAPVEVTPDTLRRWPLPPIAEDSDKEGRGRVFVLGGGAEVAGATLLTGLAALRAGAGKLQVGAPAVVALSLAVAMPEARVIGLPQTDGGEISPEAAGELDHFMNRSQAAVIGPGMLDAEAAGELVRRLLEKEGPALVVDAAAMPALAEEPQAARSRAGRLVLTPHTGEMAALAGVDAAEVAADRLGVARATAARLQAVVALKGAETLIVSPDGKAWRHLGHAPGLGTSGSGDVLAGVIAGLVARGAAPLQAAVWGVWAHGAAGRRLAGRIGRLGFLARELLDEIPRAMEELSPA